MQALEKVLAVLFPPALPGAVCHEVEPDIHDEGAILAKRLRYHDALDRISWLECAEDMT
jgi:hypothetical protein